MNVLELCLSDSLGGLELYFQQCRISLEENHISVVSVVSPNGRLKTLTSTKHQYELERGTKWFPYKAANELSKIIEKEKVELVHVHHAADLALGSLTKRLSRKKFKLVFTRQMNLPHSKKDLYHRWVYNQYDLFIVITEHLRQHAIERLPLSSDKIIRLYYGVENPSKISKYACDKLVDPDKFNIGVFSRIEYLKGQHTVIESLELLKSDNMEPHLYLFGDIMDNDYYKKITDRIATLELEKNISFMGFMQNAKEYMGCMDVVILPSENETFGLVVVEAMKAGTPVIATNAGGVPEIIDHEETGYLFQFEDSKALSSFMSELSYEPAKKKKIVAAAKLKADEVFSIDKHYDNLINHFKRLVE